MLLLSPEMCHCLLAVRAQRGRVSGRVEGQQESRRSAMKLLPFYPILWSSLVFLGVAQCETEENICTQTSEEIYVQNSTMGQYKEEIEAEESFICLLYPTNILNCSWSFLTVEEDTQLSVVISVCLDGNINESMNHPSVERVGSVSMFLPADKMLNVVLHFNMSGQGSWTTYTYMYDMEKLEVLPPPSNISASFQDENLKVTWDLPNSLTINNPSCFEYQLDMGDQDTHKILISGQQSYTELNADPTHTYSLRIRTKVSENCFGSSEWSEWSSHVKVEASVCNLNFVVILLIVTGVPMILLAVLLLIRYQRVSEILFPPIPRPPLKYKNFLEKNDPSLFFHPVEPSKPEEEITEVEEQNPGKTS